MSINSVRSEGWGDAVAFLITCLSSVFLWSTSDWYVNRFAIIAGIGAGVVLVRKYEWVDQHPIVGFPITMFFILVMLVAVMTKSLVSGAVSALTVATAIKVYDVYLSS